MAWNRLRRLVLNLLGRELKRPRTYAPLALAFTACMGAMTPAQKLDDAVKETNEAARFGRTDLAVERVAPASRSAFVKSHRSWGSDVRVVDVEYAGIEKMSPTEAIILVAFGWFRPSEGMLRATTVRQTWKNDKGSGPWYMTEESRVTGDLGLLGETVTVVVPEKKNSHFETTVIK